MTLAVHVAVLAAAGVLLRHGHHVLARYLIVGFATVMLIVVCLLKGEPLGGDSNG